MSRWLPRSAQAKILLCLALAAPAIVFRLTGFAPDPVLDMVVFGTSVVAASFLLAWAAEAAQKDISGALAIALLALIAVLPEYAVDLYYAYRSGSDPSYEQYAAANMTGSNRLLLGFGWPLVVIVSVVVARRYRARRATLGAAEGEALASRDGDVDAQGSSLLLGTGVRMDVGFLVLLAVIAFAIPVMGTIPVWLGIGLILLFGLYLWRASQVEDDGDEELVGMAAHIGDLPQRTRRTTVVTLFLGAAAIILMSAEPFADALVESGSTLGIDSFFLVQWLAPLASEAPEFIIAVLFALRGMGAAAIATLIASKVNQWSLLVGSLPLAHVAGGGTIGLDLDARQVEEFVLTASQTVLGVAIIIALRFHLRSALALAALFVVQFFVTGTDGRYVLSAIHLAIAAGLLVAHRRDVLPTLAAPFSRPTSEAEDEGRKGEALSTTS